MSTDSEHPEFNGTQEHPETPAIEIDGQQVPLEELKRGYLRQSDYTRKMQELSQAKKSQESSDPDNQDDYSQSLDTLADALAPKLRERFVSREERDLDDFIAKNPDLDSKRKLLQDLGKSSKKSYWDLAEEYGIKESDALEKSKSTKLVGEKRMEQRVTRKLADLSPEEYDQWKKDNVGKREKWSSTNL